MDIFELDPSAITDYKKLHDLLQQSGDCTANNIPHTDVTVVVKKSTMSKEMEKHAMWVAVCALSKFTVEKDAARYIKQEFDKVHGKQWHCVLGQHFGCYVSHHLAQFTYFYVNSIAVMLYRTTDIANVCGKTPKDLSTVSILPVQTNNATKNQILRRPEEGIPAPKPTPVIDNN
uniref:Dynein light chain n=1 Tax=Ditylenchus dipsaci TaxID=166011 RepID=A0A915EJB5_9BILA